MERMSNPFNDIVQLLLQSHTKGVKHMNIPLGNVATAMLKCITSMHKKGVIYVDVKPENFMLSKNSSKSGKNCNDTLSQRVRSVSYFPNRLPFVKHKLEPNLFSSFDLF